MKASILIVSRNRKTDLSYTLEILNGIINKSKHEVLVWLDGCTDDSAQLVDNFNWVKWEISDISLGASKARKILYSKARGNILFGFDDDSHPLQKNFIELSERFFREKKQLGILAFREIKGEFKDESSVPLKQQLIFEDFSVKDFLGCGFAIKKEVYDQTRGFPEWIDIYGEETAVSLETLQLGYDILFTNKIQVSHRTAKQKKNIDGANYFRFQKQLKNATYVYLVYYPAGVVLQRILRLYFHNFKKYATRNRYFMRAFFRSLIEVLMNFRSIWRHRRPLGKKELYKIQQLSNPYF